MASLEIQIDETKLFEAIQDGENLPQIIGEYAKRIESNANQMSSGFRTGIFHDHATGQTLGNTQPQYASDVAKKGRSIVGIVHVKNYAAMKDNYENNTLLKAVR